MAIRVMMVDEDINHMNEVKQYFGSSSSIEVVKTISTKEEFMSLDVDYDVLILNMLLSNFGSIEILKDLHLKELNKIVIVTSEYISQDMIEMMNSLGVYKPNYFIKKPFGNETLEKVIESLHFNKVKNSTLDNELKVDITNLLHLLGIPSHIKGYTYIRDGIELVINGSKHMNSITKDIYPTIADFYDTTSSRVERAIRHAIEVSWNRGDYSLMEEIFGNSIDFDRSKPTNAEFIATLADRLKLQKTYA